MKRVLFFGIFDPLYARSTVLREGFLACGYEVVECSVDPREHAGLRKYRRLFKQGRALRKEPFDHVLVLFPGHTVVWLARLLFGNRIIFDAFVSLYDSNVQDRARYTPYSLRALRDRLFDRVSCALAARVLVDTEAHRQYFIEHLGVDAEKLVVVPVGASNAWFAAGALPMTQKNENVVIGFYGSYIPLHGIATIVQAAALLLDLPFRFELIGEGQEFARVQELARSLGATNITFTPRLEREELIERMRAVDICLGIFGATDKASRVIPNKVYECAALGKPVITADTPAIHAAFHDGDDIALCEATPPALAQAIRALVADSSRRAQIGERAREVMQSRFTPEKIIDDLLVKLRLATRITFLFSDDRRELALRVEKRDEPDTALRGMNHMEGAEPLSVGRCRAALIPKLLRQKIIIASDELLLGWVVATLMRLLRTRTRWVYIAMNSSTLLRRHATHPVRRALLARIWKSYARIVCLSHAQMEDFMSVGVPQERLMFIPFGVDADFFAPGASVPEGEYVMSVGRDAGRDWSTLLEAARQSEHPFVIVTTYRSLPSDTPLPPNVSVRYNLSASEVRDLYARARLVVVPSKDDTASEGSDCSGQTVVLDAMAAGKPVIATSRAWLADYFTPGRELLTVAPQSPVVLAQAIDQLWEDTPTRESLAQVGRAMVQERYTTKAFAQALRHLIDTL